MLPAERRDVGQEFVRNIEAPDVLETSEYPAIAERARSLVASSRARLRYWGITDEQIETLEGERPPRRTLSVLSPVTGVVVEKMDQALDGMYVRAGMNLYKMADLTTIWVDVEVFEHQVEAMRVGQRARVELPYLPGRPYTGFVRYLYPHFDEQTRTMTVSIELENPDLRLRAGMYANVTFDVPVARNALAVPEEAVIRGGTRDLAVLELLDRRPVDRWDPRGATDRGLDGPASPRSPRPRASPVEALEGRRARSPLASLRGVAAPRHRVPNLLGPPARPVRRRDPLPRPRASPRLLHDSGRYPHPSSASDNTSRTRSTCREMDCFW